MSLVVVGSCNLDLIVEAGRLPAPGQTVLGGDLVRAPGGKGANQAVAAGDGDGFAVPGYPVRAVDTTGAGDAFCGAVAAAFAEGRSLDDAVRRGCAAGVLAATSTGAQAVMPTADDLNALLVASKR
jgi:sugar/nucleoside kinase (ribokinase family)